MKQNNLNKIRIQKGLTQKQLAEGLDMQKTHISSIERYEVSPSVHRAIEIAEFLGVKVEDLFYN